MSSMFSAPMQALQSASQSLSSAPQSFGQLLQAPSQLFGSASGLGDLLGGGSTANSFSPAMAGARGLPLGGAGPHSGAGSGLGASGGVGGLGSALTAKPGSSTSSNSRTSVLSGISTSPVQEKLAGATATAGPGGAMGPGAAGLGAGSGGRSRRSDAVMVAYTVDDAASRREAQGAQVAVLATDSVAASEAAYRAVTVNCTGPRPDVFDHEIQVLPCNASAPRRAA